MSIRNRTATIVSGAAIVTALAGAGAFAAADTSAVPAAMSGMPTHMAELDAADMAEIHAQMQDGVSVGEMHRWMDERGADIGQMHREMARAGMNHGSMHRSGSMGR